MYNTTDEQFLSTYFYFASLVWKQFFKKKLSMRERDDILQPMRWRLHDIQQKQKLSR